MLAFAALTDDQLRQTVRNLAVKDRAQILELAEHLGEVEERQLHVRWGFSSLWDFCGRELSLKDGVAHLRITLARLLRKKPQLKSLLLDGRLGLCAACDLWPYVAVSDFDQLVETATRMSKRALKELLDARRTGPSPKRDVIRRLAPPPLVTTEPVLALKLSGVDEPATSTPASALTLPSRRVATPAASGSAVEPALALKLDEVATTAVPGPTVEAASVGKLGWEEASTAAVASAKAPETRHRITFTATADELAMLRRLQDLLGVSCIGQVVGAACRALLEKKDPRQRAERRHRRREKAAKKTAASAQGTEKKQGSGCGHQGDGAHSRRRGEASVTSRSRRPPVAVADMVKLQGGEQCSFVAADGTRCTSRWHLEVDHIEPFAFGGPSTDPLNLRPLCKSHNLFLAREIFGDKVPRRGSTSNG